MNPEPIDALLKEIRACRICRDTPKSVPLGHEPRPVLVAGRAAPICLSGQAPGARVHASGRPFTDPSGDRLRSWLGLDEVRFYDPKVLAIIPMGFCFPGYDAKGSDLPPRRECRATWHDRIYNALPDFPLTLCIGRYARDYHLPDQKRWSLTQSVEHSAAEVARGGVPPVVVLPHPSWRNTAWLKRHPWFEADMLPLLRARIWSLIERLP